MKPLKILYGFTLYGLLYLPILVLVGFSFNQSKYSTDWTGFTFQWYVRLLENEALLEAARNSFWVAGVSSFLSTLLGTLIAIGFYRYTFFGKRFLFSLVYTLILSPDIIMGISLLILFIVLGIPLGFWSLTLAHITFCLPFVIVTILGRMSGFDRFIVEAAKDLGANDLSTVRYLFLPMLTPAILAGFLLSFTLSLDDVMISFFVTGPQFEILPLKIYSMARLGVKPEVNALCTILLGITLLVVGCFQFLLKEEK